jgi:hypothetical protein
MFQQDESPLAPQIIESAPAWERKPDESRRAYEAFLIYRNSATRRLAEVAETLVPACSVPNVARWSSRHCWQQRAFAWDKEEDRKQQEEEARSRSAARKRHLQIAQSMQEIGVRALLEMKAKIAAGTALNLSPTEAENFLTEAIKLERAVLGAERDHRYSEIRVFIGTHFNPDEEGYGEPQQYKEWDPSVGRDENDDEEGKEVN